MLWLATQRRHEGPNRASWHSVGRACILLASLALLLVSSWGNPVPTAGAPAETPQKGGTFVYALGGEPATVNPDISPAVPDEIVGCMVYQGLVRIDNSFLPQPLLAKSWEISPDGLTYTFHLVNAQWQDGQPLTSEDVKFTLMEVSAKYGPFFQAAGQAIQSIDTPDPQTVVIHLSHPFGPFLNSLTCPNNTAILPAHVFRGTNVLTTPATLTRPVGSGPFQLQDWVRGDHITLVRNPKYWKPGLPYLDRMILKQIPSAPERALALRAKEVDYVDGYYLAVSNVPTLRQDPNMQFITATTPGQQVVNLNVRRPPYDDRRVRQALMIGINRQFILNTVYGGNGKIAKSAVNTEFAWAYNPAIDLTKMYPFDPARARSMLEAAGWPVKSDGSRFTMHLVVDSGVGVYVQTAEVLAPLWKAIGVNVIVEGLERQAELQRVFTAYNFDATTVQYSTLGDPSGLARLYITSSINQRPFQNASGYSNPEVDQLFAQGVGAATTAQRAPFYHKVQEILANDLPTLPLIEYPSVGAALKQVHGLDQGVAGLDYWDELWVSK